MFTKPLTRVPRYILMKWNPSAGALKRLKLLSGEIACQKRFVFYR